MTAASVRSAGEPDLALALRGPKGRHRRESAIGYILLGAALISILISGLIILSLIGGAVDFITHVVLPALAADGWYPRRGEFGLLTLFAGSLVVTFIALVFAVPIGLLAAIYLAEYANPRARRVIKPVLEILAGIPSVVLGFFALTWVSPTIVQRLNPGSSDFNLFAAGLGVGILTIPLVASISEDSMRSVPRSLREAAYGLGARRMTTSLRVVVPAGLSGIVAAVILGISRALGETMVVAVAAGGSGGAQFTVNPFDPGQTITAAMAALATGSDQVAGSGNAFQSLFFLGMILFLLTFALNQFGDYFVRRTRQQY
jgi:phosphate transport system permease protein